MLLLYLYGINELVLYSLYIIDEFDGEVLFEKNIGDTFRIVKFILQSPHVIVVVL